MLARVSNPSSPQRGSIANRLVADERGSVAIIFGLSLMGVIMFVACAVDIARANLAKSRLATAVDAAAIFAAKQLKTPGATLATIEPMAHTIFDRNMVGSAKLTTVNSFNLFLTPDGNGVTIKVQAEMPTTFARVAGINKINLPQNATAVFNSQDIEVGLQLDVTGSMSEVIGTQRKIDSLKAATKNLLDVLLPDSGTGTTSIRVGIAPFAAGVNAGSFAATVAGAAAPGNCVYERRSSSADATDDAPVGSDSFKTITDLAWGAQVCPTSAKIAPLSTNKTALKTIVNGLSPNGSTAGHLGTSWAWNLISPNWSSVWPSASKPAPYKDGKTMKVAVLMTDGIYNTVGGASQGDNSATARDSQARAIALCDAMKDKGITIYSVGFIKAGDNPAAGDTLKACASDSNHFYKAEDGEQLNIAFHSIAQDISRLRLAN